MSSDRSPVSTALENADADSIGVKPCVGGKQLDRMAVIISSDELSTRASRAVVA